MRLQSMEASHMSIVDEKMINKIIHKIPLSQSFLLDDFSTLGNI